jgi:hypothetical protein
MLEKKLNLTRRQHHPVPGMKLQLVDCYCDGVAGSTQNTGADSNNTTGGWLAETTVYQGAFPIRRHARQQSV